MIRKSLTFIFATVVAVSLITPSALAANASNFQAGRIIDDVVFTNKNAMSVSDIQNFLNSKVPSCNSNHAAFTGSTGTVYNPQFICLKDFYENPSSSYTVSFAYTDTSGNAQTGSRTYYSNNAYRYTALTPVYKNGDYRQGYTLKGTVQSMNGAIPGGAISAAQIIYNTAQAYNINPQVLIVLLQKEQGLVTDTWPASYQYQSATGYGCPDYSPCSSGYAGFSNQLKWAAIMFNAIMTNSPNWYTPYIVGNNSIQWNPDVSCGSSVVNIQNRATQALYNYTPYQPNAAALAAGYGTGDSCSAYGNRNFYLYFTDWFGSTSGYIYNGASYSAVFDATYYLNNNPDVANAYGNDPSLAFYHFINYGMKEGRQGNADFNVTSYRNRYQDLRMAFGTDLSAYYRHYATNGKAEGRIATGAVTMEYITSYAGFDYSSVYNFTDYVANNADIQQTFGNDDAGAIRHFVTRGMGEGRIASTQFNVQSYRTSNYDLRRAFGNNLPAYYLHYITNGKTEGRSGTSTYISGTSTASGVDYSSIYGFSTYYTTQSDIRAAYQLDDASALQHFINYGMSEGRQASPDFNVQNYKARYPDLQAAFGNNLKSYYLHYLYYGKNEGRTGN